MLQYRKTLKSLKQKNNKPNKRIINAVSFIREPYLTAVTGTCTTTPN